MPPKHSTRMDPQMKVRHDVYALAQQREGVIPTPAAVPDIAVVGPSVNESSLANDAAPPPPLMPFERLLEGPPAAARATRAEGTAIPREVQLLREAKKRMEVYHNALSSLQSMQSILHAYDPSMTLVPPPSGAGAVGGSWSHADVSQAEDEFLVKQLLAKTHRAKKRRARLRGGGNLRDASASARGGADGGGFVRSADGSEGDASDMDGSSQLGSPRGDGHRAHSQSPSNASAAATSDEEDEDNELVKRSRWDRSDGPSSGASKPDEAVVSSNREVIAAERRLIEETIEARAEELTAIVQLLDTFREDQQARSHELDVMQSERLAEIRGLGSLIGDLASRRDAETLVYDLEMRMRMADLPLVLKKAPKRTADACVGVSEEALMVTRTVQLIARAGAPRLPVAPAGGGTTEPPSPLTQWPAAMVAPFRHKAHVAAAGGVPHTGAGALHHTTSRLRGGRSRLGGEGGTKPGTSVPDEFLCFLSARFGPPDLMDRIWRQDPVGYASATAQCLKALVTAATKWRVYISQASREAFMIAAANPSDAIEFFLMLDDQLTNQCRWETVVKNCGDMALVSDTTCGDCGMAASGGSRSPTADSSKAMPPLLFQGPRLAGFLWMSQVSAHIKGARMRCEYNPSTLRHEFVGPEVSMMGAVLRHLVRGGELLTTRDVWRCVLHSNPRRFSGFVLCETAYRVGGSTAARVGGDGGGGAALHDALVGTPLLFGAAASAGSAEVEGAAGGAAVPVQHGEYVKLMSVLSFEHRNRANFLGPHPRRIGHRQFVQPSLVVPCAQEEAASSSGIAEPTAAHTLDIPGDDQPDSEWLHVQETLTDSSVENMFSIALPEALHVLPFRRASDSSWNGIAVVTIPHVRALVSTLPNGPACVRHFFKLMWLAAKRAACSFHGGGRIHLNHLVHPDVSQMPQFKDGVTTDPLEAKAMMVTCNHSEVVWLFREPLMATTFAMMLQHDMVQVAWDDDLHAFYSTTLPTWMARNGLGGGEEGTVTTSATTTGSSAINATTPSHGAHAAPQRQRSIVLPPAHSAGGGGGVGGGVANITNGGSSSSRGLRVSIGIASGIPTVQLHPQTQLFEYSGAVMEYAHMLALQARPGEVLISPRERERLLDGMGMSIELPVVGQFYHVISVSPLRTPERLKVFAAIPSQLRDRQALMGELPASSLEKLNNGYLAVKQSADAADRRGSFYSVAATQSNAQQERAKDAMVQAAKVLLLGLGNASEGGTGSTVARHKANTSVYDNLVLQIESNQIPFTALDALVKMLEAGAQHQVVHPSVLGQQSRGGSVVGSPLAPHSPMATGRGSVTASSSFATHRRATATGEPPAGASAASGTPKQPAGASLAQQSRATVKASPPPAGGRGSSFDRTRSASMEGPPPAGQAAEGGTDVRLPPLTGAQHTPSPHVVPPPQAAVVLPPIAPSGGRVHRADGGDVVSPLTIDVDASHSRSPEHAHAATGAVNVSPQGSSSSAAAATNGSSVCDGPEAMKVDEADVRAPDVRAQHSVRGDAPSTISPSASLSPQASLAQPVAFTSMSSGHQSPAPAEDLVSSGSSSLPSATVPLGLFVEVSATLACLKTERDALRRELEETNHTLKMTKRKAMNAAATARSSRGQRGGHESEDDAHHSDTEEAEEAEAHSRGTEDVAVQTSPLLLDRSGSTTSWIPRVSVETSLVAVDAAAATAMASTRSSSTSMDPTLFPSMSDVMSDSPGSSLAASTTSPDAAASKRKKSHRRVRRHVRDSVLRGAMEMVNARVSPAPLPTSPRGERCSDGPSDGGIGPHGDAVPHIPTSRSHPPKPREAAKRVSETAVPSDGQALLIDSDEQGRPASVSVGNSGGGDMEDGCGAFSGTMHRLITSATALVPWALQQTHPSSSGNGQHFPTSPVGVMTAQSSSTLQLPDELASTRHPNSNDANGKEAKKQRQPLGQRTPRPPPLNAVGGAAPTATLEVHGTTATSSSPQRAVQQGPLTTHNSFTDFCEDRIFAPMRAEEAGERRTQEALAKSPHQLHASAVAPLHSTTAPCRGSSNSEPPNAHNSSPLMSPSMVEAPRRGTDAYAAWLAQLNDHVKTHTQTQQRTMR